MRPGIRSLDDLLGVPEKKISETGRRETNDVPLPGTLTLKGHLGGGHLRLELPPRRHVVLLAEAGAEVQPVGSSGGALARRKRDLVHRARGHNPIEALHSAVVVGLPGDV